jgi:hypothetical protein
MGKILLKNIFVNEKSEIYVTYNFIAANKSMDIPILCNIE